MSTGIQGFPLQVSFFKTDSDGFIERNDYTVTASYDDSLRQTIQSQIPTLSDLLSQNHENEIVCQGDSSRGKVIDLEHKPLNVDYILDTLTARKIPVLFVTSASRRHDSGISMEPRSKTIYRRSLLSVDVLRSVLRRGSSTSSSGSDSEGGPLSLPQSQSSQGPKSMSISPEPHYESELEDVFQEIPHARLSTVSTCRSQNPAHSYQGGTFQFSPRHPPFTGSSSTMNLHGYQRAERCISALVNVEPSSSATMKPTKIDSIISLPTLSHTHKSFFQTSDGLRQRRGAFRKSRASTLDMNVQQITLAVTTNNGYTVEIPSHSHVTIGELKHAIGYELSRVGQLPSGRGMTLTYSRPEDLVSLSPVTKTYTLFDDSQLLASTLFLKSSDLTKTQAISGLMAGPAPSPVDKDLRTIYRITQLTRVILDDRVVELGGSDLHQFTTIAAPDKTEMQAARRTLHDFVTEVTSQRSTEDYVLSVDIAKDAAPATTLILKVPYNNKLPVSFHYKQVFSLIRQISIHQTANSILKDIHHCLAECNLLSNSVEAYTMQLSGVNSYIHGNHELIAFTDIRRCITKKEPIHLSVLLKPSPLLYQPFEISWLPLDPHSYKPPQQVDVSEAYRSETKSIWECPETECFQLKLVRAENLPFDSINMLIAEFSLHHGSEMIHGVRATDPIQQDSFTMTWNRDISFVTPLRDMPKAAKVLVVLRNSNSNTYYWGMINIFDHQSRLRTGDHIINLWAVKRENTKKTHRRQSTIIPLNPIVEKEEDSFYSILSGPAVDNPNPNAVRVVLNFGSQEKPLYYPSVNEKSRRKFFEQHPSFRNSKLRQHLERYLELKFNMRSNKKPYHNLPVHIESIRWNVLADRLEVYSILEKIINIETASNKGKVDKDIERIPLHVAFRLLDKDFPDEEVRAFAVKILECQVESDTLEDYLLQLTQALKFEHSHDSALARYILKQALLNKRIGHMFFWYLRGEMQSPQYLLRFAVILEAYLKGCGEALMTKYMDHITMQDSLEAIGQSLKDTYVKDGAKMQQALPKLLEDAELKKITIVPACNPRLRLGGLRPSHCKVMSSAKKPMFLEMLNVNSTALHVDPVRLIMKMGDDLRQDMITLRMLSLIEKLWEHEGLDLKLLPYGCMATGPRTGFIEVVRNSKTIAEVSGVRENKKLYEWIKKHQIDEFGEIDPEKLKAAISTFVHSCAGYSVATYILGIGDRHNDNIMVTTSGNLFHIDFGHFLGNIKHFMTFKREWAPFVLTPDFTYVMGGEDSETFQFYKHLCIRAFLILRRKADLIINLFSMMRSTGIPELTCVEDTNYIKEALALEKTDTEAEKEFQTIIQKCLDLKWTVQIMWAIHKLRNQSPKKN